MARLLLFSELAILKEAGASGQYISTLQQVWQEYHAPPRLERQQWFNTDFVIKLNNWDQREKPKATTVPIRPGTLGADFFVLLTTTGTPTQLELLEGESIARA